VPLSTVILARRAALLRTRRGSPPPCCPESERRTGRRERASSTAAHRRAPDMECLAERFVAHYGERCANHVLILSENHLRRVITDTSATTTKRVRTKPSGTGSRFHVPPTRRLTKGAPRCASCGPGICSQHGRPMTGVRIRRETQTWTSSPKCLSSIATPSWVHVRGKVMQAVFLAGAIRVSGSGGPSIAQGVSPVQGKRTTEANVEDGVSCDSN